MKKKKTTIPSIIKWVIALILVVMQVYPFFYVFTSSFKSLDDFRQLPAYALPSCNDFLSLNAGCKCTAGKHRTTVHKNCAKTTVRSFAASFHAETALFS